MYFCYNQAICITMYSPCSEWCDSEKYNMRKEHGKEVYKGRSNVHI